MVGLTKGAGVDAARAAIEPVQGLSPVAIAFGLTFLSMLCVSAAHLLDPFVRHDDFPALLADPTEFYEKTLTEGRWLNWLWHLRPFGGPSLLHYLLYQAAWAAFCAGAAVNALGRRAPLWHINALALLIAMAPPATLISGWFNTTIPGLALVAGFALLSTVLSGRAMRWLLFLFVPATFMAYTTHPILLILICLTRADARRGPGDILGLCLVFAASFAGGVLLTYAINLQVHGVFGIEIAPWRNPAPAHDLPSLLTNLRLFAEVLARMVHDAAFRSWEMAALHLGLCAAGFAAVWRRDPWRAAYIGLGLAAGLGLLGLQIVMTGIATPTRAGLFLWVVYALVLVELALALETRPGPLLRVIRIAVIFVIALYAIQTIRHYAKFVPWQTETRRLAESIPEGTGPVFVTGDIMLLPGAEEAGIQAERALRMRLRYLTGERFVICTEAKRRCDEAREEGQFKRLIELAGPPGP